jgi:microcystin-dependent protein
MTMRLEHKGSATPAVLAVRCSIADTIIEVRDQATLAGWPTGTVGPFVVTIDRGKPNEERVLCTGRAGPVLTGVTRGWDNTATVEHEAGATVEHTFSSTEADWANKHYSEDDGAHGADGMVVGVNDLANILAVANLIPPGTLIPFAGPNPPQGWLMCAGQEVERAKYPLLFAAIGVVYNLPSTAATHFRLPDMTGRTPVGATTGGTTQFGQAGGTDSVTIAETNLPAHKHTTPALNHSGSSVDVVPAGGHGHTLHQGGVDHNHGIGQHDHWTHQHAANIHIAYVAGGTDRDVAGAGSAFGSTANVIGTPGTGTATAWAHGHQLDAVGNHDHGVTVTQPTAHPAGETGEVGGGQAVSVRNPFVAMFYLIKHDAGVV